MRRLAVAMLTVASISLSSIAWADDTGTVESFSPEERTVTIEGRKYSIPEGVKVEWAELSDGDQVTVLIDESGGEKRVTGIIVSSEN